jgi:preprotein translocase subunit YajC
MKSFALSFLMGGFGAPAGGEGGGSGSFITTLIPFALIIVIFYFLIIRPQNKKQKDTQRMLGALKKGDKVVTAGGLHGVIQSVKESTVILRVDDNTKLEFSRSSISNVVSEAKAEKSEKTEIEEKKPESEGASQESGSAGQN